MTGEMGKIDSAGYDPLNRESWPVHAAVAAALGCPLRPFDVYRGPYIALGSCRIWIGCEREIAGSVVIDDYGLRTERSFVPPWDGQAAVAAAKRALQAHLAKVYKRTGKVCAA